MKIFVLAAFLLFAGAPDFINAQTFYVPSLHSENYSELKTGAKQSPVAGYSDLFLMQPPAQWRFFDELISADSLIIGGQGFMVTTGPKFSMAFDPFLADLEIGGPGSGIYVEYDSTSMPARLSIEWRDMGLQGHSASDFVNFRLNVYSDQSVEFHYGPSEVSSDTAFRGSTGPQAILSLLGRGFTSPHEFHYVAGKPGTPVFGNGPSAATLNAVPEKGTLYRFEPHNLGITSILNASSLELYPNPVKDVLHIEGLQKGSLSLISVDGRMLKAYPVEEGKADLRDLSPGIYFIAVAYTRKSEKYYFKIIKE